MTSSPFTVYNFTVIVDAASPLAIISTGSAEIVELSTDTVIAVLVIVQLISSPFIGVISKLLPLPEGKTVLLPAVLLIQLIDAS